MPEKFYRRISVKVILILLILFAFTGTCVSLMNTQYLRDIYEKNFTQRVLLTNNAISVMVDQNTVSSFSALLSGQGEDFKARQARFCLDREELLRLIREGAPEAQCTPLLERITSFQRELDALKSDQYWELVEQLRQLNEAGGSQRVCLLADTGVTDESGEVFYTFLLDTGDGLGDPLFQNGFGTTTFGTQVLEEVLHGGKQMERALSAERSTGEVYYAYVPILGQNDEVIAVLGTDLCPEGMHREIRASILRSNLVFFAFAILIVSATLLFLRRSVTTPLAALIGVAQKLAGGDTHASVHPAALNQRSELGVLARIINDMGGVYRRMMRNRAILDSNPFTCAIFDETHRIIDCNPKTLDFYHFDSVEALNEGFRALLALPSSEGNAPRTIDEMLTLAFREGYCEFDTLFNLNETSVPLSSIMTRIEYESRPAVILYQFDLTAQKEIQGNLEYRGNLLQTMSDISDQLLTAELEAYAETLQRAFAIIGEASRVDRVYLWRNSRRSDGTLCMTKLYDWSPDSASRQDLSLTHSIPYDDIFPSCKETLLLGQCINSLVKDLGEVERRQLGAQGIVSILITPLFVQDTFWGFIGFDDCHHERVFSQIEENVLRTCGYMIMVSSDIVQNEIATGLIAAKEEALETAHMKSRFLANMSHEIRTPMNAILGMVELILHEEISETVRSHAADIKGASRGLLSIINDILDISKIESGKLEIASTNYYISSLLLDVVSIIKMRADKKRLPFLVSIDPTLPCELVGDEGRVKQILINLLSNAVKFTHEGHVSLSVHGSVQGTELLLECAVSDTGIGLHEEDLTQLFASFQQFDTKKNRDIEGTGLGLSISKQLAEMMGGSITVKSRYGVGSTFTACITQRIADARPVAALKEPQRGGVIVCESRNASFSSITCALESLGCRYQSCENLAVLQTLLDAAPVDYVFVPSLYAGEAKNMVLARWPDATVVSLGEGEPLPPGNGFLSISMPIHSLQIANVLNDTPQKDRALSSADDATLAAPDAKVLVVDDNLVNLKVAAGLLKTYEISADTAGSALQAIAMIREGAYDLVFMDHMMPEMDGAEAVRLLRSTENGRFATLPIIALTANAVSGMREMFLETGFSDYLAKPVEMPKLSALLGRWLPPEKCLRLDVRKTDLQQTVSSLKIEGLDTTHGLIMTGGAEHLYQMVLALYCHDAKKRLEFLSEEPAEERLPLFVTHVHALKSASASIGASALSAEAARLEQAGRSGDMAALREHLPAFRDALRALMARIDAALAHAKETPAAEAADLSYDLALLEKALREEDIESINARMADMARKPLDDAGRHLLDALSECVLLSDFEGALARIDDSLRKGGMPV